MAVRCKNNMAYFSGPARQRGYGLGAFALQLGKYALPFLRNVALPAAKRVGRDLLVNAASEAVDVATGQANPKQAFKRVAQRTVRQQVGGGGVGNIGRRRSVKRKRSSSVKKRSLSRSPRKRRRKMSIGRSTAKRYSRSRSRSRKSRKSTTRRRSKKRVTFAKVSKKKSRRRSGFISKSKGTSRRRSDFFTNI